MLTAFSFLLPIGKIFKKSGQSQEKNILKKL